MNTNQPFFVFDVESIGLHGEAFAVGGGVYIDGVAIREFLYNCLPEAATGTDDDRTWIRDNVPALPANAVFPNHVRQMFWMEWVRAKQEHPGILMAVECGWPVEARFLCNCIDDAPIERNWQGPYPLHDIASFLSAAQLDPMAPYPRLASESPAHNPLMDARQSARLLHMALDILNS